MSEFNHSSESAPRATFWSSLPGLLTGVAAIITAAGGIYLGLRPGAAPEPNPAQAQTPGPDAVPRGDEDVKPTELRPSEEADSVELLPPSEIRVTATSELAPQAAFAYGPEQLLDGDPRTAWAEGADGLGIGESVLFEFSRTEQLERIELVNGYSRTATSFSDNARVRLLTVVTDMGEHVVSLEDAPRAQTLVGPFGETSSVRLIIESAYAGAAHEDTLLADVDFLVRR